MKVEDGAITIPDEVLAWLGLKPGDEVELRVHDGEIIMMRCVSPVH